MPTYSYVCDTCGHRFEQFQAITDEPAEHCPSCGRKQVRRLIGAGAGLIFKGSGFYLTDYARKIPPDSSTNNGGEKKKSGKSEELSKSSSTSQKNEK